MYRTRVWDCGVDRKYCLYLDELSNVYKKKNKKALSFTHPTLAAAP